MSIPVIKQIGPGQYAVEFKVGDVVTNFTGSYEEIIAKLAGQNVSLTDSLTRTRKNSVEQLQKAREAESAATAEKIILQWLRTADSRNGGEFYCCAANNNLLVDWLRQRDLPVTSDNLTMGFRSLQESNSLALAPKPEADPEPEEAPLPETPKGYPIVNTTEEVRALQQSLKDWLNSTKHTPQAIAAFKARIDAILARENVRRQRVAAGSLAGGR